MSSTKRCFLSEKGPRPVGPYSTAVAHGGTVYMSGVTPIDPATGKLVEGGAEAEARQVFENIAVMLGEMGLSLGDVLKATVFLTDMSDFQTVNKVYAEYMGPDYPARSCVEVSKLPAGAHVEIEVVCAGR